MSISTKPESKAESRSRIPYDPAAQIRADEEELTKDALSGIFFAVIIAASAGVGSVLGWYADDVYRAGHPPVISDTEVREDSPDYRFINPIIFADDNKMQYPEFGSLDESLDSYIVSAEEKVSIDSVSVYFRDLNSGHWTGINEDDAYDPAGMTEVITMMGYFKKAEENPGILLQQIYYEPGQISTLSAGFYSVNQLLENMIIYSDSVAEKALVTANPQYISEVYQAFQLLQSSPDLISARQYSTLFRALYNGTYLSWALSERAMQLLSLTHWNDGLVAGLHEGIADDPDIDADVSTIASSSDAGSTTDPDATDSTAVSHKFGEYTDRLSDGSIISRELHDCGVIYFPGKPYLLCVMTKGSNFQAQAGVISTISRLTYNYMDGR